MGVFANAFGVATEQSSPDSSGTSQERGGLAAWLLQRLQRLHRRAPKQARLALVERISLAPRQTLALIEADGQRLLVATTPEGAPSFFPLKATTGRSIANPARKTGAEGKRI
ncbi:MAG: flagellar biosynthetic protein FliO [Terracidiphilus sp.]